MTTAPPPQNPFLELTGADLVELYNSSLEKATEFEEKARTTNSLPERQLAKGLANAWRYNAKAAKDEINRRAREE